jgi:hypothetical protein
LNDPTEFHVTLYERHVAGRHALFCGGGGGGVSVAAHIILVYVVICYGNRPKKSKCSVTVALLYSVNTFLCGRQKYMTETILVKKKNNVKLIVHIFINVHTNI